MTLSRLVRVAFVLVFLASVTVRAQPAGGGAFTDKPGWPKGPRGEQIQKLVEVG